MPAAAIPVIAGVAAGVGSSLFVTTATAIAIGSAVMSATMMLTMKKPSLGDYRSASERSQVLRAAASDKSCVYGRVISSGLMSFAAEQPGDQDEGEWLHMALVLAGTKLSRIGNIWLGDDPIGNYGGLVSWELHADRQTCDPYMLAHCADWKEDMIGHGITWLRLSLKFDAEKFPAGLPNIKVEKFGKEVWDPRDNKWKWSDNSALVILDYYRSWLKVPDDEIRIEEFIVAANICDEIVTIADGKVEPRYTINAEFDLTEPRAKVLEAMHMTCCGQPTYIGGKFGILAGAYYGPASDELRSHQLVGDLELLPEPSSSDKINQVAGTFVDPITFKKTDFPAVIVPEWVEEDGGYPLLEDLDLRFVTSEHQAQRIANIILRQRRAARTITCSVNLSGWRYRPGQTIRFYLPPMGINGSEFRVTDWAFSLNGGVDLTLREDSPLFWADAIGKPMERPEITELPTGGVAMPDQLRYDVETVGEVVQGVLTWRNSGTVNYNQVIVQRIEQGTAPVTVLTAQVPGQSCRVNGLAAGNYTAMVRALALTGAASPVAAVNFVIAAPATPIGVEVEAGNWTLAFRPRFAGGDGYGVLCEWWVSTINLPIGEVMEKARAAGMGTYMQFGQLKPDTTYYVWLRAVNAYGKSALLAASGKTTYDASSILDIIDGEIGAEHLREDLREPIELIPSLADEQAKLGASVDELTKIVSDVDMSLVGRLDSISASVDLAAEGALGAALAGAEESERQRRATGKIVKEQTVISDQQKALASELTTFKAEFEGELATTNATVQQSVKALSDADKALAEKVETVSASVTQQGEELTAAVQTVANAVASVEGEVEAGWYTKAQINGEGGGFGLSVKLNPDGSVLTSFLIDTDVFAVMSRTVGESSKINPLVVKNNSVYINHALMDTAEIGEVIAKYINVQHLVGTLIEGGSFRGGDIWLGENPNGAFSAYGKRWNAGIDSSGQFFGSNVYFDGGTFKGNVQANSGTMNNVVIREDCNVLATIYANRIVGDVCKVVSTSENNMEISIQPYSRARKLVVLAPTMFMVTPNSSGTNQTRNIRVRVFVNDVLVSQGVETYTIPATPQPVSVSGPNYEAALPANQVAKVKFIVDVQRIENYYDWSFSVIQATPMIAMAFIQ